MCETLIDFYLFGRYYAGVYPARAESYALCLAVFLGFDKGASIDLSRGYVQAIQNKLPSITGKRSCFIQILM